MTRHERRRRAAQLAKMTFPGKTGKLQHALLEVFEDITAPQTVEVILALYSRIATPPPRSVQAAKRELHTLFHSLDIPPAHPAIAPFLDDLEWLASFAAYKTEDGKIEFHSLDPNQFQPITVSSLTQGTKQ